MKTGVFHFLAMRSIALSVGSFGSSGTLTYLHFWASCRAKAAFFWVLGGAFWVRVSSSCLTWESRMSWMFLLRSWGSWVKMSILYCRGTNSAFESTIIFKGGFLGCVLVIGVIFGVV